MSNTPLRKLIRLQGYDYTQTGAYFVTLCTQNRECHFGQVKAGGMVLNPIGQIVVEEWLLTPDKRPSVSLDQFVVMPNHFHAIVLLNQQREATACQGNLSPGAAPREGTARRAPTRERFGQPVSGSLSTIIRAFKAAVTKRVNLMSDTPGKVLWQRGFYDHVIRDEAALNRIRDYIRHNPLLWELDRDNPANRGENEFYRWLASFRTKP